MQFSQETSRIFLLNISFVSAAFRLMILAKKPVILTFAFEPCNARTPIRERISGATDRSSSTAPGTKDQGIQGLRQTLLEELLEDCTNTFKNNAKRQANIGTTRLKPSMDGNEDTISLSQPKKTPICTNIGILDDLSIRLPDYGMFVPSIALSACVGLSGDELLQQVIKSGLKVRGVRLLHSGEPDYRLVKLRLVLHGLIVHKSQVSGTDVF